MEYQSSVPVKIGEETFDVSYPTVGEEFQIETLKMFMTNNTYGDLARSNHTSAVRLLDIVDAIAHFAILIPKIRDIFKLEDFQNMTPEIRKSYTKAYKKTYLPWKINTYKALFEDDDNTSEDDKMEETQE
jgi:hypothetical protein